MANDVSLAIRVSANLTEMREKMKDAQAIVDTTSSAMKSMANAYDGTRTIANANAAMLKVQSLGGASKLTESEQIKLNATLQAGLDKYAALGREAPPGMQALATATKDAGVKTTVLSEGLEKARSLLETFGIGLGVAELVNFGKEMLANADSLVKLSDQTGVSIQRLQMFKEVGEESGISVETIARSVSKMNVALGEDTAKVSTGLGRIGLSLEQIQGLSPENSFIAIANAISKIDSPLVQAAAAQEIFGKGGAEMLPILKKGFDDVAGSATRMSDDVVRSLNEADDTIKKAKLDVENVSSVALAEFIKTGTASTDLTDKFNVLRNAGGAMFGPTNVALVGTAAQFLGLNGYIAETVGRMKELADLAKTQGPAAAYLNKGQAAPATNTASLDEAKALALLNDELKKLNTEREKAIAVAKREEEALQKVKAAADAVGTAYRSMSTSFTSFGRLETMFDRVNTSAEGVVTTVETFGRLEGPPEFTLDMGRAALSAEELGRQGTMTAMKLKELGAWRMPVMPGGGVTKPLEDIGEKADKADTSLRDLSTAFSNLANVSGDSFGGAVKAIGTIVSSLDVAKTAIDNLNQALEDKGASSWSKWATAATSALAVFTASYTVTYWLLTRGDKERSQRYDEAEKQLEALSNRLQALGGAALGSGMESAQASVMDMINKLNAMPRVTPFDMAAINEAASAIDAVLAKLEKLKAGASKYGPTQSERRQMANDAYDELKFMEDLFKAGEVTQEQLNAAYFDWQKAMADAGDTAAQAWVKAQTGVTGATSAAQKAIDALIGKRDELMKSYANEAPEEEMGSIERTARGTVAAMDAQIAAQQAALAAAATESQDTFDTSARGAEDAFGRAADAISKGMIDSANQSADAFSRAIDALDLTVRVRVEWDDSGFPRPPGRAAGGPVESGQTYMVGERGPELFTPRSSGTITPNGVSLTGSGGQLDLSALTREMAMMRRDLAQSQRDNGRQLFVAVRDAVTQTARRR